MVNSATLDANAAFGQGDRNSNATVKSCTAAAAGVGTRPNVSRSSPRQKQPATADIGGGEAASDAQSAKRNLAEKFNEETGIGEEGGKLTGCSVSLDKLDKIHTVLPPSPKCEESKPTRKLLCLYCERTFASANLRQKHVERIHSAKKNRRLSSRKQNLATTPCIYCDKLNTTDNTLNDLFQHLLNEHSTKYFGCLPCEERFLTSTLLTDHIATLHHPPVEVPKSVVKTLEQDDVEDEERPTRKATRSRVKAKHDANGKKPMRRKSTKLKELRNKKLTVKSSRIALNRRESKRLQALAKMADSQKKKRQRPIERKPAPANKPEPLPDKSKPNCINPYPEFDNFYRVKKITDHSIDNLKISSLTFDDVFDKAFFNRIKCNIEENLLHHIDGKLFKNEESESRISNFEKVSNVQQEVQNASAENFGCELSLNAVTPVAALSLNSQFGEDFESQIEYGSKPSKKKAQTKKDEVHYKYFTRRKYQASILEHKENRDLSKLDMWTQLVIKKRQQKIIDDKKTAKEIQEYTTCDEYRNKVRREELNRILDRRGPFEDLREEASKKAALDKLNSVSEDNISHESFNEVREVLHDLLNKVFQITEETEDKAEETTTNTQTNHVPNSKTDLRDIPSFLNLRQTTPQHYEDEIDQSDKITLICSSQETENFELPTNSTREKDELIQLSGEWARCRMYICAACGAKLPNMRYLLDHKNIYHQNVWVQHYEFVGNQSELYRHLSIPVLGKVGYVEDNASCKLWKRSDARVCSKCKKRCKSLGELHRHMLECGGDWTWLLERKKCKYRYGAKSRRRRRGLIVKVQTKRKTDSTEKKKYKYDGPRQKPSDAETIQRMLANLPAKRSTRKLISLYDGVRRKQKKQQIKTVKQKKVKCGKVIYNKSSSIKETTEKTINTTVPLKKSQKNSQSSNIRSLRSLGRVLSSRILDTNKNLTVKRKLKALNDRRKTRNSVVKNNEVEDENLDSNLSSSSSSAKKIKEAKPEGASSKRTSPRSTKIVRKMKLLTGNLNIKAFFPVKKRKDKNNDNEKDVQTRSKKKSDDSTEEKPCKPAKSLIQSININKKKTNKKPSQETPAQESFRKEESDGRKRKLKQSFRSVINRVKRLKIDTPNTDSPHNQEKQTQSRGAFLDEGNPENDLAVKIVIPSNIEAKENIADISETARTAVTFNETNEDSPVPENIFKLDTNNEKNLQAKGEQNFDTQPIETKEKTDEGNKKLEVISVETSVKPKVVPMISPSMKGKIRKPTRGLNDCIAMLTSKLQQKTENTTKPNSSNILSIVPPPKIVTDPTPHITECILKIPTFKTNTEPIEEVALDLSTKSRNRDENTLPVLPNIPIITKASPWNFSTMTSVERIIENVVSNRFQEPEQFKLGQRPWNSIDQTIQNVIDGHLEEQHRQKEAVVKNSVDEVIEYVVQFSSSATNNLVKDLPLALPKNSEKIARKIGTVRKLKKPDPAITKQTSSEVNKDTENKDESIQLDEQKKENLDAINVPNKENSLIQPENEDEPNILETKTVAHDITIPKLEDTSPQDPNFNQNLRKFRKQNKNSPTSTPEERDLKRDAIVTTNNIHTNNIENISISSENDEKKSELKKKKKPLIVKKTRPITEKSDDNVGCSTICFKIKRRKKTKLRFTKKRLKKPEESIEEIDAQYETSPAIEPPLTDNEPQLDAEPSKSKKNHMVPKKPKDVFQKTPCLILKPAILTINSILNSAASSKENNPNIEAEGSSETFQVKFKSAELSTCPKFMPANPVIEKKRGRKPKNKQLLPKTKVFKFLPLSSESKTDSILDSKNIIVPPLAMIDVTDQQLKEISPESNNGTKINTNEAVNNPEAVKTIENAIKDSLLNIAEMFSDKDKINGIQKALGNRRTNKPKKQLKKKRLVSKNNYHPEDNTNKMSTNKDKISTDQVVEHKIKSFGIENLLRPSKKSFKKTAILSDSEKSFYLKSIKDLIPETQEDDMLPETKIEAATTPKMLGIKDILNNTTPTEDLIDDKNNAHSNKEDTSEEITKIVDPPQDVILSEENKPSGDPGKDNFPVIEDVLKEIDTSLEAKPSDLPAPVVKIPRPRGRPRKNPIKNLETPLIEEQKSSDGVKVRPKRIIKSMEAEDVDVQSKPKSRSSRNIGSSESEDDLPLTLRISGKIEKMSTETEIGVKEGPYCSTEPTEKSIPLSVDTAVLNETDEQKLSPKKTIKNKEGEEILKTTKENDLKYEDNKIETKIKPDTAVIPTVEKINATNNLIEEFDTKPKDCVTVKDKEEEQNNTNSLIQIDKLIENDWSSTSEDISASEENDSEPKTRLKRTIKTPNQSPFRPSTPKKQIITKLNTSVSPESIIIEEITKSPKTLSISLENLKDPSTKEMVVQSPTFLEPSPEIAKLKLKIKTTRRGKTLKRFTSKSLDNLNVNDSSSNIPYEENLEMNTVAKITIKKSNSLKNIFTAETLIDSKDGAPVSVLASPDLTDIVKTKRKIGVKRKKKMLITKSPNNDVGVDKFEDLEIQKSASMKNLENDNKETIIEKIPLFTENSSIKMKLPTSKQNLETSSSMETEEEEDSIFEDEIRHVSEDTTSQLKDDSSSQTSDKKIKTLKRTRSSNNISSSTESLSSKFTDSLDAEVSNIMRYSEFNSTSPVFTMPRSSSLRNVCTNSPLSDSDRIRKTRKTSESLGSTPVEFDGDFIKPLRKSRSLKQLPNQKQETSISPTSTDSVKDLGECSLIQDATTKKSSVLDESASSDRADIQDLEEKIRQAIKKTLLSTEVASEEATSEEINDVGNENKPELEDKESIAITPEKKIIQKPKRGRKPKVIIKDVPESIAETADRSLRRKPTINYSETEEMKDFTDESKIVDSNDAEPNLLPENVQENVTHEDKIAEQFAEVEETLNTIGNMNILKENISTNSILVTKNGVTKKRNKLKAKKGRPKVIKSQKPETEEVVTPQTEYTPPEIEVPVLPVVKEPEPNKEPPIKIIINKHMARRKSKNIKKVSVKSHNDLFEDFSLVIKKKRPAPIITFSPPDTFSKDDTYSIDSLPAAPESIDSVEEMDMELDDIPINTNIIETQNLELLETTPVHKEENNNPEDGVKTPKVAGRRKRGKSRNKKKFARNILNLEEKPIEDFAVTEKTEEIPILKLTLKPNQLEVSNVDTEVFNEDAVLDTEDVPTEKFVLDKDDFSSDDFDVDNTFEDSMMVPDNLPKKPPSVDADTLFDKLIENSEFVKPIIVKKPKKTKKIGRTPKDYFAERRDEDTTGDETTESEIENNLLKEDKETLAAKEDITEENAASFVKPVFKSGKKGKKKASRKKSKTRNKISDSYFEEIPILTRTQSTSSEEDTAYFNQVNKPAYNKTEEIRKEDIDKLYAFSESEDFELEKPLELHRRLPRKNNIDHKENISGSFKTEEIMKENSAELHKTTTEKEEHKVEEISGRTTKRRSKNNKKIVTNNADSFTKIDAVETKDILDNAKESDIFSEPFKQTTETKDNIDEQIPFKTNSNQKSKVLSETVDAIELPTIQYEDTNKEITELLSEKPLQINKGTTSDIEEIVATKNTQRKSKTNINIEQLMENSLSQYEESLELDKITSEDTISTESKTLLESEKLTENNILEHEEVVKRTTEENEDVICTNTAKRSKIDLETDVLDTTKELDRKDEINKDSTTAKRFENESDFFSSALDLPKMDGIEQTEDTINTILPQYHDSPESSIKLIQEKEEISTTQEIMKPIFEEVPNNIDKVVLPKKPMKKKKTETQEPAVLNFNGVFTDDSKEAPNVSEETAGRKSMRSAKAKALESIHDEALAELTEDEINSHKEDESSFKKGAKKQKKLEHIEPLESADESTAPPADLHIKKKAKRNEKLLQLNEAFDFPPEVPLLEDLVAELDGLEELENSIERELNAEMNLQQEPENKSSKEDNLMQPTSSDDINSEDNQERRRSRRGFRKVASYNENDLIDPLIDALENKRKGKKKDDKILDAKQKKLNSEQLFDLLKASSNEPKSLLNNIEDSTNVTVSNFNNMFENMLEKTFMTAQKKDNIDFINNSDSTQSKKIRKLEDMEQMCTPQDSNSESRSRSDKFESNFCEICNKSFVKLENLIKHRRTLTHIQKLSEIEAKEAEKSKIISRHEDENSMESVIEPPSLQEGSNFQNNDLKFGNILTTKDNIQTFDSNNSLKLADIICDVLNKPVVQDPNNFIIQNDTKRYKSLGERKSFDSDTVLTTETYENKTTNILEKQISLLENIIEHQTTNNTYIDDISITSEKSDIRSDPSSPIPSKPPIPTETFLKPTQYEEISEDSTNLRSYEEQKLRKTLNRDEELFLECCSLLKSSSEVSSSYSSKKMHQKLMGGLGLKPVDEPEWLEKKDLMDKNETDVLDDYSDNSRIPTPLGNSYDDDASGSNTISSNWEMNKTTDNNIARAVRYNFENITEREEDVEAGLEEVKRLDPQPDIPEKQKLPHDETSDSSLNDKKFISKGARKVFEGLKVSIPTEELNLDEVFNNSPKQKKLDLPVDNIDEEKLSPSKPSKNSRKSKPVKKSQVGSNLLFKVNKKKLASPSMPKEQQDDKGYDVYDFEETQDNTDVFTKPDYRAFRNLKTGENDSDTEADGFVVPELQPATKKTKAQENITKKKCMIMGRIFKNAAAKSKIEDIDEEIRNIPVMDNDALVESYVADCTRVFKDDAKNKNIQEEIAALPEENINHVIKQPKIETKKFDVKKRQKFRGRKRMRSNSDSTDDEFSLNKTTKRKTNRKNAKAEDNCINLEQELKECIGVASRKSQRKCTSGKQNVLVEYWSSDDSQFEALLEKQIIEVKPKPAPKPIEQPLEIPPVSEPTPIPEPKKVQPKKRSTEKKRPLEQSSDSGGSSNNRRKRAAVNPLYHWSSSSEDEANDLIEVKPLRDEIEDDEDRPVQHGWIVGDSPKKLVTMLAQAKGKKPSEMDSVKEQGKKRTNTGS